MLLELDAVRNGRQSVVDEFAAAVLTPVESAVSAMSRAVSAEGFALAHAGSIAAENDQLRRQVKALAASRDALAAAGAENADLRRMLHMRADVPGPSIAANVVGYAPESSRREVTIDRGWRDGVKRDAVVVDGAGLVGHVIDAGPHDAHVLLIVDPSSAVPAYLEKTRSWGIVVGTWQHVAMKYIAQDKRVSYGELVVTGQGEVYPGGIPIGRVREVDRNDSALSQRAVLDTMVDLSALSHVLVLPAR
jgi:rod shape-determining protein MreC